ncbi:hypothetical protein QNM99_01005 [Pseudomonas sp. PCH446]
MSVSQQGLCSAPAIAVFCAAPHSSIIKDLGLLVLVSVTSRPSPA